MTGTFEGVGSLQFSPDNKLAYSYSGNFEVDDTEFTLLEFKTESEYIMAIVQFNINEAGAGESYQHQIYFNDVVVQGYTSAGGTDAIGKPDVQLYILVPPFTTVKFTSANIQDSASRKCIVSFTGKVQGAVEQQNLESITDDNKWAEKGPF